MESDFQFDNSYVEWLKNHIRNSDPTVVKLIGSSVPEPTDMLVKTIQKGFEYGVPETYTSVFVDGNSFVIEQLASNHGILKEQVICTTGATSALAIIYKTFVSINDEILIESPGVNLFSDIAKSENIKFSYVSRTPNNFNLDINKIEKNITANTKLLVLSNPHNPSGSIIPLDQMKLLADMLEKHNIYAVVDEVYSSYAKNTYTLASKISDRFISISSLTKNYGLSSLRCGWIIADVKLAKQIRNIANHIDFGVSKVSHCIASMVLRDIEEYDKYREDYMADAYNIMLETLLSFKEKGLIDWVQPDSDALIFIKLKQINNTQKFANWLHREKNVVVTPGEFFMAPGFIRIGFPNTLSDLRVGLDRFIQGVCEYTKICG